MRLEVRVLFSVVVLLLSACVGGSAIPEFREYRTAFRAQQLTGAKVFDRLAESERRLIALERGAEPLLAPFDPDAAAGYLGVGDPPRTAALRAGLEVLAAYNEALAALASGATAERPTADIAAIGANLTETGAVLTGGAAGAGFDAMGVILRRVLPVLRTLRGIRDREAFREQLIAAHADMRALLVQLRAATPAIFAAMREARVEPGNLFDPGGIAPAGREELAHDRRLLAGWVVLIDQTLVAMGAAVAAAQSGDVGDVAALVAASANLRALALAVRAARLQ